MGRKDELVPVYIAVDERGDLGMSYPKDRFYVIVGCVLMSRRDFESISKRYVIDGREVKYHDNPELREPIMRQAAPIVLASYYARYHKDPSIHNNGFGLTPEEKADTHLRMMDALSQRMYRDLDSPEFEVDIDRTNLVKDYRVRKLFEENPYRDGRTVDVQVKDSKSNYGLMTNDFLVGAIGSSVTDPSDHEARRLVGFLPKTPKQVHLKNRKSRWWRNRQ